MTDNTEITSEEFADVAPKAPKAAGGLTYQDMDLPAALKKTLADMNFVNPTPIQAQAIPFALEGKDVMGTAQTGTGKTAAFAVPIVAKLLQNSRGTAIVLLPTRELAVQVVAVINQLLGKGSSIKAVLLIGGDSMPKQIEQLRRRPRIYVGTPGRINDHLRQGTLMLADTAMLVLDETDRMLDMGFGIQIDAILKFLPKTRQNMLFSATMPREIIQLSQKYLNNPERITVGSTTAVATNIKQETIRTENKYDELVNQLGKREGTVIVFVKTKFGAERLALRLEKDGHSADTIHGDLRQNKRDRVIKGFRDQRFRILVATDVAARGLDIPHIEHVVNYDLPQVPEDYIHRIGRTARAGAEGSAISFVSGEEMGKWKAISRMLDPNAKVDFGGDRPNGNNSSSNGKRGGGDSYKKSASREMDYASRKKPYGRFNKESGFGAKNSDYVTYDNQDSRPSRPAARPYVAKDDADRALNATDNGQAVDFKLASDNNDNNSGSGEGNFGANRPERGSFKPRGDRPAYGDRKPRGDFAPRGDRPSFGDRKPRGEFAPRGDRPSFGDRKPRGDFAPRGDRADGQYDRKPRTDFAPRGDRPAGGFNDRPAFGDRKPRGDFAPRGDRPSFGDRKPRGEFSPRSDSAPRGEFKPRGDFAPRGERPQGERRSFGAPGGGFSRPRSEGGFSKPRGDFAPRGDRPSFGDRKPRGEFQPRGERSEGGFKPRGDFQPRGERPAGGFGDRKPRSFGGDRPTGGFGAKRESSDRGGFKPRETSNNEGGTSFRKRDTDAA